MNADIDETKIESAWQDGPYLVVRRLKSELPDFCICCNAPATERLSFAMRPDVPEKLAILFSLFLARSTAISYLIFTEKVYLKPALCDEHRTWELHKRSRTNRLLLTAAISLLLALIIYDSAAVPHSSRVAGVISVVAALQMIGAMIHSYLRTTLFRVEATDRHFGWITGVSLEYLHNLPLPPESPQ